MSSDDEKRLAFVKRIEVLTPCFATVADAIRIRYDSVTLHRPHNPVPTQLPAIIETSFAASLRREEQRPIQFQIVCAHPNHSTRWGRQHAGQDWDFGFISNNELTVENIRKLSPALDHETSAILVWDGASKPVINGIVRFKKTSSPRRPHELGRIFTTERALRITATAPGAVVFDSCELLLGELVDGVLTFPQAIEVFTTNWGVFTDLISGLANIAFLRLPEYLRPSDTPFLSREWSEWSEFYKSTLQVIVHSMRRTRCGGTLIVSNAKDIHASVDDVGFAVSDWSTSALGGMPAIPLRMEQYFRTLQEADITELRKKYGDRDTDTALFFAPHDIEKVFSDHAELMRAARFVGQLTAVDGAVILRPDLSVFALGAKLKTGALPKCRHVRIRQQCN